MRTHRETVAPALRAACVLAAMGGLISCLAPIAAQEKNMDRALYGEKRPASNVRLLQAGPVRCKFQDGELRYLYVGEREIVRRVYFAVRDRKWDTVMPKFDSIDVQAGEKDFRITLSAVCKNDFAEYVWQGQIVGSSDGKITFRATGRPTADFRSPRIGFCVLYGTAALGGQAIALAGAEGDAAKETFPQTIQPAWGKGRSFRKLLYVTPGGMTVTTSVDGGTFGIEDQRQYGDSSCKAYASMTYAYPNLKATEETLTQTVTIAVEGAKPHAAKTGPVRVRIGDLLKGARVPKLTYSAGAPGRAQNFGRINRGRAKLEDAESVAWELRPSLHMPDDDTFMENLPAIGDQVALVRSIAPKAKIRVSPIRLDSPYPRAGRDPRNKGLLASAWAAGVIKYLAESGVDEAAFFLGDGPAKTVVEEFALVAGNNVREAQVTGPTPRPVEALAIDVMDGKFLWLVNKTPQPQDVVLEKLPKGASVVLVRFDVASLARKRPEPKPVKIIGGELKLKLSPLEACKVRIEE